jgi:hypothetical protein
MITPTISSLRSSERLAHSEKIVGWGGVWVCRERYTPLRERLDDPCWRELREDVCCLEGVDLRRVAALVLLDVVREREVLDFLVLDFRFWAMMDSG